MKHTPHAQSAQSATSLPRAPRDDVESRSVRYLMLMGIRVICFILMIVVRPYGLWTVGFGLVAVFTPYIAVVLANVASAAKTVPAVPPERELEERATPWPATPRPQVIRIQEHPRLEPAPDPEPAPEKPQDDPS